MSSLIRALFKCVGIDRAIAYSSAGRIIQAAGGALTVFFIAARLSGVEQGYYYTFGSIIALQIFFELGLGGIIVQYVAYEVAQLEIGPDNNLEGDSMYLSRLSSLFRLFFKWYLIVAFLFLLAVSCGGIWFFNHNSSSSAEVNWKVPWLLLSLTSALNLLISPAIVFVEGLGKVKEVARLRMITQTVSILCVWATILLDGKLYAPSAATGATLLLGVVFINRHFRALFSQLYHTATSRTFSYYKEIFPYQWRIALSWISGYFIFQLFNPVLFAYCGADVAGQMGMTLAALNGILSLTLSWTSTKIPFWSGFIAREEYDCLNRSYSETLKNSSIVCMACLFVFWSFLAVLDYYDFSFYGRFLPIGLSIILGLAIFFNNIINIWATYLRCHKREPFLIQALVVGTLCAVSTILCGKYIGVRGVVIGFTSIVVLISFPLSYHIFKSKCKEYHG